MKKKSTAVRFNGLFLFSYAAGAIGTTQTIPYLVSMGFEGTQKGIILSGMAISTLVTQFLFGYLSDVYKRQHQCAQGQGLNELRRAQR